MKLSIIVSWRDRKELRQALPSLVACAQRQGGEVVVVNLGGDRRLLAEQVAGVSDLRVLEGPRTQHFNKPVAQNLGARHSQGEYLFFCDCDIILDLDDFERLCALVAEAPRSFGTLAGVTETDRNSRQARFITSFGYELHLKAANGREVRIIDHEEDATDGTRMAPGLLLIRRSSFLEVGGYNAGLDGWGWEDQDMICRLTLGAGLTRIRCGRAAHISHDDHARVQHYPAKDRWESRDRMFRRALANYDDGNFLGTYAADLHRHQEKPAQTGERLHG